MTAVGGCAGTLAVGYAFRNRHISDRDAGVVVRAVMLHRIVEQIGDPAAQVVHFGNVVPVFGKCKDLAQHVVISGKVGRQCAAKRGQGEGLLFIYELFDRIERIDHVGHARDGKAAPVMPGAAAGEVQPLFDTIREERGEVDVRHVLLQDTMGDVLLDADQPADHKVQLRRKGGEKVLKGREIDPDRDAAIAVRHRINPVVEQQLEHLRQVDMPAFAAAPTADDARLHTTDNRIVLRFILRNAEVLQGRNDGGIADKLRLSTAGGERLGGAFKQRCRRAVTNAE